MAKSESSQPKNSGDGTNVDPAKAAFLAALEAKKNRGGGAKGQALGADKSDARKSGPDAARRMFQRRSGNS
jgi:hypothetical protein